MKKIISALVIFVSTVVVTMPFVVAADNVATGSDPKWKTIVPIVAVVAAIIFLAVSLATKKKD